MATTTKSNAADPLAAAEKQAAAKAAEPQPAAAKKSGLKSFKINEVIFQDGEKADSLYIIQKGQIRLYKPKGKGYVELAVLRAGEVIGEMAFFSEDGSGNKRSCAAMAISPVDVIEITFAAFGKTMDSLNPWFKTIINTFAGRLRKANTKIKELESNSVSIQYGANSGDSSYQFFRSIEIVRLLSVIYLVFKGHSDFIESTRTFSINATVLKYYAFDIFTIQEAKYEEFFNILQNLKMVDVIEDSVKKTQTVTVGERNLEMFRELMNFFNAQRVTANDKKISINLRCEIVLDKLKEELEATQKMTGSHKINIATIFAAINEAHKTLRIGPEDLEDAKKSGLLSEVEVGDNNSLMVTVDSDKLMKLYPSIKMQNTIERVNEEKSSPNG